MNLDSGGIPTGTERSVHQAVSQCKVHCTKYKLQSIKCKAQIAKCKVQSAYCTGQRGAAPAEEQQRYKRWDQCCRSLPP